MIQYKCACILFQLAELICYTYGLHFVSSVDALSKAFRKTGNNYFKMALNIKRGNESVVLSHFISAIDELIKNYTQKVNPDYLPLLKRIVFHHSSTFDMVDQRLVESENNKESCSVKYKKSVIATDETLHIIINDKYEFNK